MKKFFMIIALAAIVSTVNAQKLGIWYGMGFNKITADKVSNISGEVKSSMYYTPLNFGVTYTHEINDFDVVGGLSLRQKGTKTVSTIGNNKIKETWKPLYVQLDVLGAYNFVNNQRLKFGIQTGPYVNYMVSDDDVAVDVNKCDVGWQAGLAAAFSGITLSAGYECGFIKINKNADKKSKNSGIYIKFGYEFDL